MKKFKLQIVITLLLAVLLSIISFGNNADIAHAAQSVSVGGDIVGFSISYDGVRVVDFKPVTTKNGQQSADGVLKKGDLIISVYGVKIKKVHEIAVVLDRIEDDKSITIVVIRDGNKITLEYLPLKDAFSGVKKLGVVVKDSVSGLGTVTFVSKNGEYVALGHAVSDGDKEVCQMGGVLYNCVLTDVVKSERGKAGSVSGYITSEIIGSVTNCTRAGLCGTTVIGNGEEYEIAKREEVKPGRAQICSAISGKKELYDIEIIRAVYQKTDSDKGLIIKVTDKRLIELTGGIVQGMSGSPIIQNDKIIGAVTHVFVNDPTRGYGIYLENMMSQMGLEI